MTFHLKTFWRPGFSGPSAQVSTYAVSPPSGAASLDSGTSPMSFGTPLITKTGRLGSASSGLSSFTSRPLRVTAMFGIVLSVSALRTLITRLERLASFWSAGKRALTTFTL